MSFFKRYKQLLRFLLLSVLIYILWFVIYELWLHPKEILDLYVIKSAVQMSDKLLSAFGYNIQVVDIRKIIIENKIGVIIGDECNGLSLFALYSGFLIAFPGNLKSKFYYIPLGILVIHLINVLRISVLLLIQLYAPQYLAFNHTYTFTILIYGVIFLMWVVWVNKYGLRLSQS